MLNNLSQLDSQANTGLTARTARDEILVMVAHSTQDNLLFQSQRFRCMLGQACSHSCQVAAQQSLVPGNVYHGGLMHRWRRKGGSLEFIELEGQSEVGNFFTNGYKRKVRHADLGGLFVEGERDGACGLGHARGRLSPRCQLLLCECRRRLKVHLCASSQTCFLHRSILHNTTP